MSELQSKRLERRIVYLLLDYYLLSLDNRFMHTDIFIFMITWISTHINLFYLIWTTNAYHIFHLLAWNFKLNFLFSGLSFSLFLRGLRN